MADAEAAQGLPSSLAYSIGFLATYAGRYLLTATESALSAHGLRARHAGLLSILVAEGPMPQHTMSRRLNVDRTTMVALVDELERRGLISRRTNPADRRVSLLTITPAGEEIQRWARQSIVDAEAALLQPLDAHEQVLLRDLLLRVARPNPGG